PGVFGHEPRRPPARDRRMERPSLVHRRPVPPRAEIETLRAASLVRGFRAGGEGGGAAGVVNSACLRAEIAVCPTSRWRAEARHERPPLRSGQFPWDEIG